MNASRIGRLVVAVGVAGLMAAGSEAMAQQRPGSGPKPSFKPNHKPTFQPNHHWNTPKTSPAYFPPKPFHPPVVVRPHPYPGWGWQPPVHKPVFYHTFWGGYPGRPSWNAPWYFGWKSPNWGGWYW